MAETAVSAASDVTTTAKEEAANVVGESVAQAKDLAAQVKDQATTQLASQSEKLTDGLRSLSGQLREGDTSGAVGQVLTEAGQRLTRLTDYVERVGPEGLLKDVRGYARRNPGSFLLSAALAGVVSGRMMKGISAESPASSGAPAPEPGGTAAGTPLAGVSEPGIAESAAYPLTPYPENDGRGGAL